MSPRAHRRAWRYMLYLAAFAAGAAAALAGPWLLPAPPPSAPETAPRIPAAMAPIAPSGVPPASAAAFESIDDIRRLPGTADRMLALYLLADRRDAAGVALLIDQAAAIEQPGERAAALSILHGRYAHLDPAAALRHVQRRTAADTEPWLEAVFRVWGRSDLAAALRHAETLGQDRSTIAGAAILQARDDLPQVARAEIAARLAPRGELLREVVHWPMDGSLAEDPALAWRQAVGLRAGRSFLDVMLAAPADWDGDDPEALFFFGLFGGSQGDLREVAKLWARTDARAALDAIESADDLEDHARLYLRDQVMWTWVRADPAAALEWALGRPPARSSRSLVDIALNAWADTDPRAALDAVQSAADVDAGLRDSLRWNAVARWVKSDPSAALDWAMALPDPQARSRTLDAALHGWAHEDPRTAAAWLDSQPPESISVYMLGQVAAAYARHHPEEAVAWAAARADGIWSIRDVFTTLSHEDTERAARLLALVEDAEARRAAEHILVGIWAQDDPRAALAWLNRHADPDRRAALHSTLLCAWVVDDFAGAMRHLDGLTNSRTRNGLVFHHD